MSVDVKAMCEKLALKVEAMAHAPNLEARIEHAVKEHFRIHSNGKINIQAVVYACGEMLTSALTTIPDPGAQVEMIHTFMAGIAPALNAKNADQAWFRAAQAGEPLKLQ